MCLYVNVIGGMGGCVLCVCGWGGEGLCVAGVGGVIAEIPYFYKILMASQRLVGWLF